MRLFVIAFLLLSVSVQAQFAPAAGKPGSTAVFKDSSVIVDWATNCSIIRGWKDIAQKDSGFTDVGTSSSALGKPDGQVVSLGDSGVATLEFKTAIANGPGPDFVVFENSFSDDFLELAFVEVSSNGVIFVRFPATSLTQDTSQTNSFGSTDPTLINNLAGKYRGQYGVPFDLEELSGMRSLDVENITHVRVVDVIGTIDTLYASRDAEGKVINDPYPTLFGSGGFDLDAVGVIHNRDNYTISMDELKAKSFDFYPTVVSEGEFVHFRSVEMNGAKMELYNTCGELVQSSVIQDQKIQVASLIKGVYFMSVTTESSLRVRRKIIVL